MKKLVLLSAAFLAACQSATDTAEATKDESIAAFPIVHLDTTVAPCDDFFTYTAGGWREMNPIPETEVRWGEFNKLGERNKQRVKTLLERLAAGTFEKGTDEQLIGDLVASGMDSVARNERGTSELIPFISEVDAVEGLESLFELMAKNKFYGVAAPISVYVGTDAKESTKHTLYVSQSGIGLPDRDYYLRDDAESKALQSKYRKHIRAMGEIVGVSLDTSAIYDLEERFAKAMKSRVEMRDAEARYNPMSIAEWQAVSPNLPITTFMETLELGERDVVNSAPIFFERISSELEGVSLSAWKHYYKWHIIDAAAGSLNDELERQNFEFFEKTLSGKPKMNPRWKRVQGAADMLGEQIGHLYAKQYFPEEHKKDVEQLVENLRTAFSDRIDQLTWMTEETKVRAKEKLAAFTYKIGYPDQWEDISDLDLSRESYFANLKAMQRYFTKKNLAKIDEPVDKNEWGMGAHIVNAYYNPLNNEVVFPAGILQPPFYNPDADAAINYGAIGGVIGHEFSHGFDDQGSKYGPDGNLENWWTEQDKAQFEELTERLAAQYDAYEVLPDVHVNGHLTLGENIADLGGLTLAYYAFQNYKKGKDIAPIDGFTADQRVFLGWAQVWQSNGRDEYFKQQVTTDPHSPAEFRVIGPVSNMPEFRAAFGCQEGANIKPAGEEIIIW